jgi:hypothetical protein
MAVTTKTCASFEAERYNGIHTLADVYKLALIRTGHTGTYNHTTTNVGTPGTGAPSTSNLGTDEVTGAGYTAGGITLGTPTVNIYGNIIGFDFPDPSALTSATFSADGGIIYNSSKSNRAVQVVAFAGAPVVVSNGTFTADFPAAGSSTSLIRTTV